VNWSSTRKALSSPALGNRCWGRPVTPHAARFKTPGLNLSRYERPLAERGLLGGAARDRWELADRLPLGRSRCGTTSRTTRRKRLVRCGMMEMSLAETRVSDGTRGTTTASSRRRLAGAEGGSEGARTGSGTPICICTANVSNVLLVGARRGTRKRPAALTNSLKVLEAKTRLGGFRSLSRAGGLGRKRSI